MLKPTVVALFLIAVASSPLFGQGRQTLTFQKDAIREDAAGLVKSTCRLSLASTAPWTAPGS